MAVIFGGTSWRADLIDFTGTAVPGGQTEFTDQFTFNPGFFNYSLNDSAGSIKLRPVPVENSWATSGGGTSHAVFGTGLTVDPDQNLTGGTVNVLAWFQTANPDFANLISGVSISVADLIAAVATDSGRDDAALIRRALAGNDLAGLSNAKDDFNSGGGIDLIFSNGGNDKLTLGASLDAGLGGRGDDTVIGGGGDDLLVGNEGRDKLMGGAGFDILDGGKGHDVLSGGSDPDTFVFLPGDGSDRINGFNPDEDIISFGGSVGLPSALHVTSEGNDAIVTYNDNTIRLAGLAGVTVTDLDVRFGFHVSESRLDTFVNFFDFKG